MRSAVVAVAYCNFAEVPVVESNIHAADNLMAGQTDIDVVDTADIDSVYFQHIADVVVVDDDDVLVDVSNCSVLGVGASSSSVDVVGSLLAAVVFEEEDTAIPHHS